jgi:hypothetical protein
VFYFSVICLIVFCCFCLYIFCVCLYKICGVIVYFGFFFLFDFLQLAIERRSVSSIACAGLCSCMLARIEPQSTPTVHSARAPHGSTRVRSSAPWCDRAHSIQSPPRDLFRSPSSFSTSFPLTPYSPLSHPLRSSLIPKAPNHHFTTQNTQPSPPPILQPQPLHCHATAHRHRRSHFPISPHFSCFLTQTQLLQNSFFLSIFFSLQRHIPIHGLCHF